MCGNCLRQDRRNGSQVQAIGGDATEEFGIEVGGFLGHDFVGGGDVDDFFDVDGIEKKRDLGAAGIDGGDSGGGFAFVGEVHFLGGGLQGDAESGLENAVVEQNDVEFALEWGDIGQELSEIGSRAQGEEIESAAAFGNGISADGALRSSGGKALQEAFAGIGLFGFVGELKNFGGKPRLEITANGGPGEIVDVGDDTMSGQDGEAFAARVDEGHHGALVGSGGNGGSAGLGAAFVTVVQSGFVAMMAVGDDQFLVLHGGVDGGDALRIGDGPEAMDDAVFVGEFGGGRRGGFGFGENSVHAFLRVGIEHEELAGMQTSVAEEFEAVGFGAGESVFVAEDDAGGIVFELTGADEAAARAFFGGTGDGELLGVGVESGCGILEEDAVANPLFDFGGGARVDVVLRRIVLEGAAFFDGDQIVRMHGVIFGLALGGNFVVRLSEDAIERGDLRVETKGGKRKYLGHEFSKWSRTQQRNPLFYAKRSGECDAGIKIKRYE